MYNPAALKLDPCHNQRPKRKFVSYNMGVIEHVIL